MANEPKPSRLQTAQDGAKALKQYEALRRSNMVRKAVVVAELKDGSYHILGQQLVPAEMAPLLMIGAEALAFADADRQVVKLVARQEPERRGIHNQSKPRARAITKDADGVLVPPPGENFVSCGECHHPTWHVLHFNDRDQQSRIACAHCGNEVVGIRIDHPEGHA